MRIVAGAHRGRALVAPKGHSTRPTADRARQAIFNILDHAPWAPGLHDIRVLDLFAGSGALGIEALSRGAAYCLFIDTDPAAREAIESNIASLRLNDRAGVARADATRLGSPPPEGRFDLVFLDPPYNRSMIEPALESLGRHGWLSDGAIIVVERDAGEPPLQAPGYVRLDVRDWGVARVHFLAWRSAPAE
jgi:16S rRNA (guanine966-N2)-methyltransferase